MNTGHWNSVCTVQPEEYYGFIYNITHRETGKKYIGKKVFRFKKKLPPLKGKKRRRVVYYDSDWKEYTGSSKSLNEDIDKYGKDAFDFLIVSQHKYNSSLWYAEIKAIVECDALLYPDRYYNGQIPAMKFRPKLDDK